MKILKKYTEPTTIIITGEWVVDHKHLISYTDDECVISVRKSNGEIEDITALGGLTILNEEEFNVFIESNHYKMHCDSDFNKLEHMYIVIKDFVGIIGATLQFRRGPIVDDDKWDINEYITYQFDEYLDLFIDIDGDYHFKSMPIEEVIKFLESDKTSKSSDILSEDTKEQLFGEIENQGFGYWIQHYGYKGNEDDVLVHLCKEAQEIMDKVEDRLKYLGVEI